MPEKYKRYYPTAAITALLILCYLSLFSVRETEFVLVTQFGRPVRTVTDAGLKVKWFFQTAIYFDRRLRVYNPRPSEFLTRDKKNVVIENYVMWKIQDPDRFVEVVDLIDEPLAGRLDVVRQKQVWLPAEVESRHPGPELPELPDHVGPQPLLVEFMVGVVVRGPDVHVGQPLERVCSSLSCRCLVRHLAALGPQNPKAVSLWNGNVWD